MGEPNRCGACGQALPEDAAFCYRCGRRIARRTPSDDSLRGSVAGVLEHGQAPAEPTPPGGRDLPGEAHVLAIASWYFAVGVVPLLGLLALWTTRRGSIGPAAMLSAWVGGSVLFMAIGLLLRAHRAPARTLVTVQIALLAWATFRTTFAMFIAAATLAAFAAAWLWSVAVAAFLFRARGRALLTPAYRRLMREDPGLQVRKYGSPFFYVPMALVVLFLLSALASWVTR